LLNGAVNTVSDDSTAPVGLFDPAKCLTCLCVCLGYHLWNSRHWQIISGENFTNCNPVTKRGW